MSLYKISKTRNSEPIKRFLSLENARATYNTEFGGKNIAPRYRLYKWNKIKNMWESI